MQMLACELGAAAQEAGLDNIGKTEKSLMGNLCVLEGEHSHVCAWLCSTALLSLVHLLLDESQVRMSLAYLIMG